MFGVHKRVSTGRQGTRRLLSDRLRTRRRSGVPDNIFAIATLLDHAILLIRCHKAAIHQVPVIDRLQMLDILERPFKANKNPVLVRSL
jgi:hypothetical protein